MLDISHSQILSQGANDRGFGCDLCWGWNIDLSSCKTPVRQWLQGWGCRGSPPVGGMFQAAIHPVMGVVHLYKLPWQPCPSNLESFMKKITLFMEKKKKKGHLSPRGSVLSLEDFSYKASHKIKRLWRLVNTNRKRVKTTFICTNSGFVKLKNLCPVKQLVQKIYFEYKNEERNIFK